jgi:hypothetical protein
MPEVRKRVLYCAILLIVVGATSCLFGAVYFSSSKPMPYHLAFIGMSFEELIEFNPNLATLLAVMVRTVGVCEVAVGILVNRDSPRGFSTGRTMGLAYRFSCCISRVS